MSWFSVSELKKGVMGVNCFSNYFFVMVKQYLATPFWASVQYNMYCIKCLSNNFRNSNNNVIILFVKLQHANYRLRTRVTDKTLVFK